MHIGVKLLYDHGGSSDPDVTKELPTPTVNDSGKVSIGKIRKDDLAFRMNVASRKVLRKVHTGFIITEPNMRRRRIRRRSLQRRGFRNRVDLLFGAISRLTERKRERERERETSRRVSNIVNINKIEKRGMYA